jgi:tetratricopeptide (TPR) repeat protein
MQKPQMIFPRVLPFFFGLVAVLTLATPLARGVDFSRDTAPGKWFEPLVPEELPAMQFPAYFNDLDKAKAEVFAGRYRLALQGLRSIKGGNVETIALAKAQALEALGRDDEALAALTQPAIAEHARVQLERIAVLDELGRREEAVGLLKDHLRAHPDSISGHFELGRISEELGEFETARTAYQWYVDPPQDYLNRWRELGEKLFDSAEDATTVGRALERWATLSGEYQKDSELHDTILDFFVKSYDVIDRDYWPAHLAAAEYFLAHDDADNARKELKGALRGNPSDGQSYKLAGLIAVQEYDFAAADAAVDGIRRSNPTSVDADLLETRNLLRQRMPKATQAGGGDGTAGGIGGAATAR